MFRSLLQRISAGPAAPVPAAPAPRPSRAAIAALRGALHRRLREGDVAGALSDLVPALGADCDTRAQREYVEFALRTAARLAASGEWRSDLAYQLGVMLLEAEDDEGAEHCARLAWGEVGASHEYRKFVAGGSLAGYCAAEGLPHELREELVAQAMHPTIAPFTPYPASLCLLREGLVLGQSFLPASADDMVFVDRCLDTPLKLYRHDGAQVLDVVRMAAEPAVWIRAAGEPRRHRGPHVLIGNHDNVGHWLLYYFSRLRLVETMPALREARIVIGDNARPFHLECLARAGIAPERVVRIPRGQLAQFEELWVPSFLCGLSLRGELYCVPGTAEYVRERLRAPAPAGGGKRRLYVGRRGVRWRRVVNEDEVAAALAALGFEEVDPGKLDLAAQAALAAQAEAIVGVFGAGMNLHLFANAGVPVVQLQAEESPRMNIHPLFAATLGQPFHAVVGSVAQRHSDPLKSDFRVPVPQMVAIVEQALRTAR